MTFVGNGIFIFILWLVSIDMQQQRIQKILQLGISFCSSFKFTGVYELQVILLLRLICNQTKSFCFNMGQLLSTYIHT